MKKTMKKMNIPKSKHCRQNGTKAFAVLCVMNARNAVGVIFITASLDNLIEGIFCFTAFFNVIIVPVAVVVLLRLFRPDVYVCNSFYNLHESQAYPVVLCFFLIETFT